jgi:glycosyltransferase involved in cell wall biosynthesis
VIAPRGEFSRGAIALKAWKKRPYIALSKALGLYSDLRWQASSAFEVHDIQRVLSVDAAEITIAPNLPPVATRPTDYIPDPPSREPGPLRIIFLSRISPMKNLDYLLRVLAKISRPVELSIMGPIDAPGYWEECRVLIKALPGSISVTYAGEVEHKSVAKVFSEHDLFVFPTRGENFGHVIYESLAAGTPVMLSDQTPWVADGEGSLEILPLSDPRRWVEAIGKWARLDEQAFATRRTAALQYARQVPKNSTALEQNRALFQLAASSV